MRPIRINAVRKLGCVSILATSFFFAPTAGNADFLINDDLIVDGSACIGFD